MIDTDCPRDKLGVMLLPDELGLDWRQTKTWHERGWPPLDAVDFSAVEQRERAKAIEREHAPIRIARFDA